MNNGRPGSQSDSRNSTYMVRELRIADAAKIVAAFRFGQLCHHPVPSPVPVNVELRQ